jgi:hypothetical protein
MFKGTTSHNRRYLKSDRVEHLDAETPVSSDEEGLDLESLLELQDLASSAEKFCADSSSQDGFGISANMDDKTSSASGSDPASYSGEDVDSGDEDSCANGALELTSNGQSTPSAVTENSDADDEESSSDGGSERDSDSSTSSPQQALPFRFSGHHTCNLCEAEISHAW